MTPGLCSVERAESTAQGRTAAIAVADVVRAETSCQHHAAVSGARPLEVLRVPLLPGQVDDGADLLVAAQQHGVARAVTVLALVELDQVGVRLLSLADEDGDPQDRLGRVEHCLRPSRALRGEDEADEVGAGFDGDVDVLLARQAADLDERPRDELGELRAGVRRTHQRRADQDGVRPRELRLGRLRPRLDRALGDQDPVARSVGEQPQLGLPVDAERGEVAGVDADDRRAERRRALEFDGVVRLDQRVEAERARVFEQRGGGSVREVAQDQQRCVGAGLAGRRRGRHVW